MTHWQTFLTQWYFHIPDLIMTALIYLLSGRCIVSLLLEWNSDNVVVRVISSITDPVLRMVGVITPRIVPPGLLIIFSVAWLFAARLAFFFGLVLLGMRPSLSG